MAATNVNSADIRTLPLADAYLDTARGWNVSSLCVQLVHLVRHFVHACCYFTALCSCSLQNAAHSVKKDMEKSATKN